MFDGRNYKIEFEEACVALTQTNDKDEIRQILIGIEWVLNEAIRGAFIMFAFALTAIAMGLVGLFFDFQKSA